MSKLIDYILQNFTKLAPLDYLLILIVGYMLFLFFKKIYEKCFETQKELIKLKDEVIKEYKSNLERAKDEQGKLQKDLKEHRSSLHELLIEYNKIDTEKNKSQEEIKRLRFNVIGLMIVIDKLSSLNQLIAFISYAKSVLCCYLGMRIETRLKNVPEGIKVFKKITKCEDKTFGIIEMIRKNKFASIDSINSSIIVPKDIMEFDNKSIGIELIPLVKSMNDYMDKAGTQ